jgi:VWFA-related protein
MKSLWHVTRRCFCASTRCGCVVVMLSLSSFFLSPWKLSGQAAGEQQARTPSDSSPGQQSSAEMAVKDDATVSNPDQVTTFRVKVGLVLARVVVRDSAGQAVGTLRKEDFELFDNGKPQVISDFDVQHGGAQPSTAATVSQSPTAADGQHPAVQAPIFPVRYVAYLFDDVHLKFQDIALVRSAAHRRLDALAATDRVAIFSTSGRTTLDFTDDRAQLNQTLDKLAPRPISGGEQNPCPDISLYEADLIVRQSDPGALQTAITDYVVCTASTQAGAMATTAVQSAAAGVLSVGEQESRISIEVMKDVVRRMMAMPGVRNLVLVSPGFLTPDLENDYSDVIDRALRAQVVINTLDARGLYVTPPGGDASQAGHIDVMPQGSTRIAPPIAVFSATPHDVLDIQAAAAQDLILASLANGTGGTFFHNNNDMDEGLRRLAGVPEYSYILGFTPQNLKTDGKFHALKVSLKAHGKYDVQARLGYYAPRHGPDAAEEAKREIDDEILSSEELHELPVQLHTQFFKPSDDAAKLTVLARVDVKRLHYKQADGRNQNDLTVVTAVFDHNGNILQSNQKVVQMRWKNETLQGKLASGITLKTSFDVKPGRYLVRVVARDTEQRLMSAENGAVDIP